jgi:transposase
VLRSEVSRSMITVHLEFHALFKKDSLHKNNVARWYRQFVETGCLCKGRSPGRPRVSDDKIDRVREAFQRSSRKPVARTSWEFGMPKMTAWKLLRKLLCFKLYKMLLVQAHTPADKVKRREFC